MNNVMFRDTSHKSLMKTITLLYMLNECFESSKDNQSSKALSVLSSIYQLLFQCEKQIVKNLMFLSATTHNSTRVTTICLEKARDRRSCTIRLTSNNDDIDEIVLEFKLMTKILKQAVSRDVHFTFD